MKLLILLFSLTVIARAAAQEDALVCPSGPPKHISIKQGDYSPKPGTVLHLENFAANIVPLSKEMPLCFKNETLVQSGSITIDSESLSKLFNDKAGPNPKMKDLKLKTDGQNLSITGTMHKVVAIHFEIKGPLKPAQHGDVRMQVEDIHAAGIPIKGIMSMLGSDLGSMMGTNPPRAISVENNTIVFYTEQLMHFRGEITAVRMLKDGVRLEFGSGKNESQAEASKQPVKQPDVIHATSTRGVR